MPAEISEGIEALLGTVQKMNDWIKSLEKQLRQRPQKQDIKEVEKKVSDQLWKDLPHLITEADKNEIAVDVIKNTKQMVLDIKSDYSNKVKKIVVEETSRKV